MKRILVRALWLPLILATATAFGQAVSKTGSANAGTAAEPATPAKPPALSASLLLIKADWSKVPAAKDIEAELRAALKDATVPKELLDELPASGPQILFSPETAAIYKPEHYRELVAWLKAKNLLIDQSPFANEKGRIDAVFAGNVGGIRSREFTAKFTKPYDFLKLPPIPAAVDQPFVTRRVEFQWHAGNPMDGDSSFWVERRLVILQETRGREQPEPARPVDTSLFRWRKRLPEQVVVFDTFPGGLDSELAAAARRQGFVALVAVQPADQATAGDVPAKLHLPDTVQVDIAKKGATHHWTQPYLSPLGAATADFAFPISPPQANQGKTAPSANPSTATPKLPSPASSTEPSIAIPGSAPATSQNRRQPEEPRLAPPGTEKNDVAATTPAAEFTASLMLISGDWSKSSEAKQIEADLRAALKDEAVDTKLLENLPHWATVILFPAQAGSVYTEQRFDQFVQWLAERKLTLPAEPFRGPSPLEEGHGPASRQMVSMSAEPLGLSSSTGGATPLITQTAAYHWGFTSQTASGDWWVGRELFHYEQTRGEKSATRIRTNEYDRCAFTFPPLAIGQVFVVPAFPETPERSRVSSAPLPLIFIERRKAPQTTPATPILALHEHVERIEAKRYQGSRSGGGPVSFDWPPTATVPPTAGSPLATGPFAPPPVDANGKPVGSAARQVTDGKIIIAWSEGKDVAWGFSASVGKWARQEINPPANGSSWPIVGGGSSVWQVGSAYYGFSGKVAQWDVLRLPDGHEPKATVFQDFVVVNDGTAFYAFGGKTARWDVVRLPDNHKPTISFDANYVRVSDGDDVYVFADSTGHWSSTKDAGGAASDPKPADDSQIKVFTLQHAQAADLARMILQIVGKEVASVAFDERTNTIVARGPPETLEVIRVLLLRLDELPDPKTKPAGVEIGGLSGTIKLDTKTSAAELTKQYATKEQQAAEIAAQLRELQAEKSSNKAQVQKLTADLRRAVSEAFAARQQLHQAELAELTQRMRQIEQTVQLRGRISEQIIDRRVQDLLNPNLQWDQLAESRPGLPGATTTSTSSLSASVPRPRVLVGAAFGAEADKICNALGITVHRLTKEEVAASDPKLLGCLKITATAPPGRGDFHVGDIITMMQTEGDRDGLRKVTIRVLRGTEQIPMTAEIPSSLLATTKTDAATFPIDPAAADATDAQPAGSTPRPRVMYGAAFGADADKVWNSIGIKVHLLTFDETAPDHKHLGCPRITFVDPDGPAHDLQVGDLIITLQVGSTGRNIVHATLDILRGMESLSVVVEYESPTPTKGQSASKLRRPREPKVSVGFGSEAFRICESLGLTVQNLKKDEISDPKLLSALKISAISSDSPASELKVGDIITMMQTGGALGGGRRLTMNILRGSEAFPVTAEYPAAPAAAAAENDANSSPSEPSPAATDATDTDQLAFIKYGAKFGNQETKIWNTLGVKVVAVAKEDLPISGYQGGAKITEIRPDGPAAGLHVGDIIVGLLNWDVTSPERLLWALSQPISNTSGRGQAFGKFWNVETAIIYFLRDKSSLQATIEFRLESPPAAGPPPTPVNAGSADSAAIPADLSAARTIRDKQRERWQILEQLFNGGRVDVTNVLRAAEEVGAAEMAAAGTPEERRATQQEQVERLQRIKSVVKEKHDHDLEPLQIFLAAEAALLKAEADAAAEGRSAANPLERPSGRTSATNTLADFPQPLILRNAGDFGRLLAETERDANRSKDVLRALEQDKGPNVSIEAERKNLLDHEQRKELIRQEYAAQIRLLDLAFQDAQYRAVVANQNARRIELLVSKGVASQEEVEKARQGASSAQHQAAQLTTLLDLYRKADPPKAKPNEAADDKPPQPTTQQKQGEGKPR